MKNTILKLGALLMLLSITSCEEDDRPDLPACDYIFECKVNGQSWKPKARWNCPDMQVYFTTDTIGNWIGGQMIIRAKQCLDTYVGITSINIVLDSLYLETKPKDVKIMYRNVTELYASMPREQAQILYDFDSVLTSSIIINEFVPENYSQDYTGGYINMSFSATLMNGVGETVEITEGKICQRFQ